jgi:nucleoside-diphosphate-sugar epimerase
MNKKVLVVGCSGEVGSRLTRALLDDNYIVYGLSGQRKCKIKHINHFCQKIDLLNINWDVNIFKFNPVIMVLAAWITTPKIFWNSQLNYEWVRISLQIIDKFKISGGKYLIVTSSCAEYSWSNNAPLSEISEVNPATIYGKAKLQLFNSLDTFNLPFLWTRTFFQFGMSEPPGRLIPTLIDTLLNNKRFIVENPNDIRDFVFIKDVVNLIKILLEKQQVGIFNIGSGHGIQVKSIAQLVAKKLDREDLITFNPRNKSRSVVISNPKKLLSIVENYSWTPLHKAILATIKSRFNN